MTTDSDAGKVVRFPRPRRPQEAAEIETVTESPPQPGAEPEERPEVVEAEFVDLDDRTPVDPPDLEDLPVWRRGQVERRPVVPPVLQKDNRRAAASYYGGLYTHRVAYHGIRLPAYALSVLEYAPRGAWRIAGRVVSWVTVDEAKPLKAAAVRKEDHATYLQLDRVVAPKAHARRIVLGGMSAVAVGAAVTAGLLLPELVVISFVVAVVLGLGYAGRPIDRPMIGPAVVLPQQQKLTSDIVMKALVATELPALTRKDARVTFPAPITRDGPGWRADVDLPLGVTATDVIERRDRLASALRRPLGCVWPESAREVHEGRLVLWVGDEDMRKAKQPTWPLRRTGAVDLFRPQPFGTDQRGRWQFLTLMFISMIIGAVPRIGKTFALRVLLLIAALDPRSQLHVYDNKGTGDLSPLECVAHCYGVGDEPDDIEREITELRAVQTELRRRAKVIRDLPKDLCPENKVTPQLADQRSYGLYPIVIGVDECFPAGTLIGGRPIETLRAGDVVPSWDEQTRRPCMGQVVGTMAKRPQSLVQVRFGDGTSLVCTPNHPLMTRDGWRSAGELTSTSEVMRYGQAGGTDRGSMLHLRREIHSPHVETGLLEAGGTRDLLGYLPRSVICRAEWGTEGSWPGSLGGSTAGTEPHVGPRGSRESVSDASRDGTSAESAGWERSGTDGSPAGVSRRTWLADGGDRTDRRGTRTAETLEAGCRPSGPDGRGGSGRRVALLPGTSSPGPAERSVASWSRVDRVEVLEPGSDGRYGGLCPDGFVYNFEVADTHTYLVGDGYLAHNCQIWFEHETYGKEFESICTDLVKRGPALGIVIILATQRPDAKSLPTGISANAIVRFCLKVMGQVENDMVLGVSSHKNGIRANMFSRLDLGIGWLVGEGNDAIITRTPNIDQPAAEAIALRARAQREVAGTLTGYCIGEQADREPTYDLLDDLQFVYAQAQRMDRPGVWSVELCAGLAKLRPQVYGGWDQDTLAAALKPYALQTVQLNMLDEGSGERRNWRGIKRDALEHALAVRAERRGPRAVTGGVDD